MVLHHAQESRTIRSLVAIGSAFVYKLAPGNANQLAERSELDLDPEVAPELRTWIDSDMLFHAEVGESRGCASCCCACRRSSRRAASSTCIPASRAPPGMRVRPAGFDPLCAVIADKDVARAVREALHADVRGVFNVAAREVLPLSVLGRWTRRPCLPVPGPLSRNRVERRGALRQRAAGPAASTAPTCATA